MTWDFSFWYEITPAISAECISFPPHKEAYSQSVKTQQTRTETYVYITILLLNSFLSLKMFPAPNQMANSLES